MANDELGLFRWLSNVDKFGFSFVLDVPQTTEATEKLSERIGFIRKTQCRLLFGALSHLRLTTRRWKILGLYFRPCKRRHSIHDIGTRCPHR